MEKIASDLKESEQKQRSLGRALEALQSQASSSLLFSIQWKDLEDHFESTRAQIQTRFEELKTLEMKAKELEKVEELIDQGKRELGHLELLIEKRGCEVEEKKRLVREISEGKKKLGLVRKKVTFEERELEVMQGMLENCCEEIEAKRRELSLEDVKFGLVKSGIVECERELRLKEVKMSLVEKSIEECMKGLDEKEKIVREMDEWKCKLEKKESELEGWAVRLALKEKQVKSKVKEVGLAEKRVLEKLSEVQMKEKDFDEQIKAISEGRKHLDSLSSMLQMREWKLCKQVKDLNLEKQKWESIERSTKECTEGSKSIEDPSVLHLETDITRDGRGLRLLMNEQLKRIDQMNSKMSAVFQGSSDPAKLVLDAMQGFHQPNPNKDNEEIDFVLEITRRSCIVLLKELKRISTLISPPVKEEAMKLATEWKSKLATGNKLEILGFLQLVTTYELTSLYDANELQGLLAIIAQPIEANESQVVASEITITPPPGKDEEHESSLAKYAATSPIPQPSGAVHERNPPEFQNEQMVWKHSLQSKIFVALEKSSNSDPAKLLLDLMQVSFAAYWMKEDVDFEPTAMNSFITLLETVRRVQPHVGPQLKENATNLAVQWKKKLRADDENSWEILGFLQFIATYELLFTFSTDDIAKLLGIISQHTPALELCQTLVLADKLPDIILNLVQSKQLVEAVRLICTFKLSDKFPPAPLLHQFVEDSWNRCSAVCMKKILIGEKDKVVDSQIADLRAVIQCINRYNLQSEYQPAVVEVQIDELKKLKENWRLSAQSLVSQIEPQEQSIEKKRSPSTPTLILQPQQQPEYNDHLTAISAARPPPYPLPTCIPSYPQSHSSPMLQTNYGFPMPTNGQPCASSYGDPFMPTMKRPCMMNFGYQAPAPAPAPVPVPVPSPAVPFMPMKLPCMMNPGYQAPAPVPSPAPTPAQMHSANYNVAYQFPHPNMLQFRG